jgi:PAS domain S-box-containing protein
MMYINPAAERVYGRTSEEFYQDAELWWKAVLPEDQQRVLDSAQRLLEDGHREVEYRIVRPNGDIRWLLDRARVIRDAEDHPVALGGIATDVTDLKLAEAKLEAEDQLLRSVLDRQERERQLVASEIHDGVVQDIVGAKMVYEGIVHALDNKTQFPREAMDEVKELLEGNCRSSTFD